MIADPLLRMLHLTGVAVWVGGMFFAYLCLRPVAGAVLEPPPRLRLWRGVFARLFPWVWASVAAILLSGGAMMAAVGMAGAPRNWHLMLGIGIVMAGIFCYVWFGPYRALGRAVDAQDWPAAGAALNRIRQAVGTNLVLGLANIAVATLGRWLA
ncbi:CopD family protein [Cupriavidus taiwanensis]|uniref:CopD family protein n=1 Tax=Cupriavidus taiwanensis TaxID=164546 RepID=UPI001573E0FC|nr:CopD family protein [Cupriavidus taiwanensis]NSX14105.1 CopD family protein [Cupriavidus taiwanensis]